MPRKECRPSASHAPPKAPSQTPTGTPVPPPDGQEIRTALFHPPSSFFRAPWPGFCGPLFWTAFFFLRTAFFGALIVFLHSWGRKSGPRSRKSAVSILRPHFSHARVVPSVGPRSARQSPDEAPKRRRPNRCKSEARGRERESESTRARGRERERESERKRPRERQRESGTARARQPERERESESERKRARERQRESAKA